VAVGEAVFPDTGRRYPSCGGIACGLAFLPYP
jgi:hypothetical protein